VCTADSGRDALPRLQPVISDLNMPRMPGLKVTGGRTTGALRRKLLALRLDTCIGTHERHNELEIFQHANWGTALMRADDDMLLMVDHSFTRMHQWEKNKLIGKPFAITLAPEVRPNLPLHRRLADKRGHSEYMSVHLRQDGKKFAVLTHLSTIRDIEGKIGYRVVNISERKSIEDLQRRRLKDLRKQLHERALALRQVTDRLLRAQDDEHRRIARELHDSVGQYLVALKMDLERLAGLQSRSNSLEETKQECLSGCLYLADACLKETRTLSHLLHPPLLDETGFVSAARWYVVGFAKRSGIHVNCTLPEDNPRFSECVELVLFRTLQESLTNIYRHSGSKSADIRFIRRSDHVTIRICDRGRGIDACIVKQFQEHGTGVGIGLAGIRERVIELDGRLDLRSDVHGTAVTVSIPVAQRSKVFYQGDLRKAAAA
jgi:PAS domain S-box-containing protein